MKIIACIDDNNGMLFGGRRQSRDKLLTADIIANLEDGESLCVFGYSARLFADFSDRITIISSIEEAEKNSAVFIEKDKVSLFEKYADTIIIYKWNKVYPADFWFDIDLNNGDWTLADSFEFQGNSHKKITREVYTR
ncbi:MAG: ribonuclease Z [Clostridiales bacterium]|nr:ribonuclease Z [Clostridiales bacterium]